MKLAPLLLAASVIGNAALIALIVMHAPGSSGSASSASGAAQHSGDASGNSSAQSGTATANGGGKVDPTLWSKLSAGDYAATVAKLRAEGFPPSLVRAIVRAEIAESFAARRKALNPPKTDIPFWQAD